MVAAERTTSDILNAALDGDGQAWRQIVEQYSNLLWWIARSHRLDDATSADVVQTVWLQLIQHGRSIKDPSRLVAWLSTTARRESARRARNSTRVSPMESVGSEADQLAPPIDQQIIDDEIISIALAAFEELDDACRQLLKLVCADPPMSYAEIAALLRKPHGSIGPTRQRCLAKLRATIRGMGGL